MNENFKIRKKTLKSIFSSSLCSTSDLSHTSTEFSSTLEVGSDDGLDHPIDENLSDHSINSSNQADSRFSLRVKKYFTMKISKSGEGVVWWRTRDTRAPCHNRVTAIKMEHFLKSPCFFSSYGRKIFKTYD